MNRSRLLFSVLAASSLQFACASPATPPKSSPVYGEAFNPAVKPIEVETASVNEPESQPVTSASQKSTVAETSAAEADPAAAPPTGATSEKTSSPATEPAKTTDQSPAPVTPEAPAPEKSSPALPAK